MPPDLRRILIVPVLPNLALSVCPGMPCPISFVYRRIQKECLCITFVCLSLLLIRFLCRSCQWRGATLHS